MNLRNKCVLAAIWTKTFIFSFYKTGWRHATDALLLALQRVLAQSRTRFCIGCSKVPLLASAVKPRQILNCHEVACTREADAHFVKTPVLQKSDLIETQPESLANVLARHYLLKQKANFLYWVCDCLKISIPRYILILFSVLLLVLLLINSKTMKHSVKAALPASFHFKAVSINCQLLLQLVSCSRNTYCTT